MLPINYPDNIEDFKLTYLQLFDIDKMQIEYRKICRAPRFHQIRHIKVKEILIGDFEFILDVSLKFFRAQPTKIQVDRFKGLFNYDASKGATKYQPYISNFFINNRHTINISTCYFCNIDYINAFIDGGDYHDFSDFINNASIADLAKISLMSETTATAIYVMRQTQTLDKKNISTINGLGPKKVEALTQLRFKEAYSHFTLDHILPKAKYPILALSVFNFVPCCYSCNSKFKVDKELVGANESFLSPTSQTFSFHHDNSFKLFFKANKVNTTQIVNEEDFACRLTSTKREEQYNKYIEIFKLNARYKAHKADILDLITKNTKYSKTKIKQISDLLGENEADIKSTIFGKELFEGDLSNKPKTKLLKDIAQNIKLI
jgi:hypothetical protein